MTDSEAPRPVFPIAATVVWGALLIPGLLGAALSPMFFDAPGSMSNPAAYVNALIVVSFPLLCLVSIAGSWISWSARKHRPGRPSVAQVATAALPVLPIAYVAASLAIEMLSVLFSGQPMGLHETIIRH